MHNKKTLSFSCINYCDGCSRFCKIGIMHDSATNVFRPTINNTIIYDYTPNNTKTPQIQIFWDRTLAHKKAIEITNNCKLNRYKLR